MSWALTGLLVAVEVLAQVRQSPVAGTYLYVRTVPGNARVYLEGQLKGVSGSTIAVAPGRLTVTVEWSDGTRRQEQVEIQARRVCRIEVRLHEGDNRPSSPLGDTKSPMAAAAFAAADLRERRIALRVLSAGGQVKLAGVTGNIKAPKELPPSSLRIQSIFLWNNANVRAVPLAELAQVATLQGLEFSRSSLRDDDLAAVGRVASLLWLHASFTSITDGGLEHIQGLAGIQTLNLAGTQITDAGLVHLRVMRALDKAYFSETALTDDAVERLQRFEKLRLLDLRKTGISSEGVKRLQAALPNCQIVW